MLEEERERTVALLYSQQNASEAVSDKQLSRQSQLHWDGEETFPLEDNGLSSEQYLGLSYRTFPLPASSNGCRCSPLCKLEIPSRKNNKEEIL